MLPLVLSFSVSLVSSAHDEGGMQLYWTFFQVCCLSGSFHAQCSQRPCGPDLNNLFLMINKANETETYLANALLPNEMVATRV